MKVEIRLQILVGQP